MSAASLVHQMFTYRGEHATYQIRDGWMRVYWGVAVSDLHEVKETPEKALAVSMLVQMPEWLKKYPGGVPPLPEE